MMEEREENPDKMPEKALARPGVRETMQVYGYWQKKDRGLDPYRSAIIPSVQITTRTSDWQAVISA